MVTVKRRVSKRYFVEHVMTNLNEELQQPNPVGATKVGGMITWLAGTLTRRPKSISQNVIAVFVGCRTMTFPAAPCALIQSLTHTHTPVCNCRATDCMSNKMYTGLCVCIDNCNLKQKSLPGLPKVPCLAWKPSYCKYLKTFKHLQTALL